MKSILTSIFVVLFFSFARAGIVERKPNYMPVNEQTSLVDTGNKVIWIHCPDKNTIDFLKTATEGDRAQISSVKVEVNGSIVFALKQNVVAGGTREATLAIQSGSGCSVKYYDKY